MVRKCTTCLRNRQERFFTPRGRVCDSCQRKSRSRAAHARRVGQLYGITEAEYQEMFRLQYGGCAICNGTRPYRLAVDHDHQEERDGLEAGISQPNATRYSVRGLLCKRCNSLLARVHDDIDLLTAASHYLANWPSKGVIT